MCPEPSVVSGCFAASYPRSLQLILRRRRQLICRADPGFANGMHRSFDLLPSKRDDKRFAI
jgi:hypothetical protein